VVAMIEAGAVKSTINMLQSGNDDVRNVAIHVLSRMEKHGTFRISYPCVIDTDLTNSTQQNSRLP
jgi:hypothetical protein